MYMVGEPFSIPNVVNNRIKNTELTSVPNKICHFSLFCINLVNFTGLLHCFTELCRNCVGKNADKTEKKTERRKKGALFFMPVGQREWFLHLSSRLVLS